MNRDISFKLTGELKVFEIDLFPEFELQCPVFDLTCTYNTSDSKGMFLSMHALFDD